MTQKRMLFIGTAIAGALAIIYVYSKAKNKNKSESGGNGNTETPPKPDPNEPTVLPYKLMADELFESMNGYGTSESKIYNILNRLQKNTDWNTLVTAYGTRKLSSGAGNIFVKDFNGNLPDSLRNELDNSEIKAVNQILSKIGVSI